MDLEGLEFFKQRGGQVIQVPDTEIKRWLKAVEPVMVKYKKDMVAKGFKAAEIDDWIKFLQERITYWKAQEKARKIPTAY